MKQMIQKRTRQRTKVSDLRRWRRRFHLLSMMYLKQAQQEHLRCGRGYLVAHLSEGLEPFVYYFPAGTLNTQTVVPPHLVARLRGMLELYDPEREFIFVLAGIVGQKTALYSVGRVVAVQNKGAV